MTAPITNGCFLGGVDRVHAQAVAANGARLQCAASTQKVCLWVPHTLLAPYSSNPRGICNLTCTNTLAITKGFTNIIPAIVAARGPNCNVSCRNGFSTR